MNSDVVENYSYDVYGAPSSTSSVGNPYFFTGRRLDTETGLYYYRARMYDPVIGRFIQTDPIGYASGLNLYSYVSNNPLNWVDPLGNDEVPWCPIGAGGPGPYYTMHLGSESSEKTDKELELDEIIDNAIKLAKEMMKIKDPDYGYYRHCNEFAQAIEALVPGTEHYYLRQVLGNATWFGFGKPRWRPYNYSGNFSHYFVVVYDRRTKTAVLYIDPWGPWCLWRNDNIFKKWIWKPRYPHKDDFPYPPKDYER